MERIERLGRPKSRERVLSDPELKSVWQACDGLGMFGKITRLCILLGQRRSEIAHLKRGWVNEDEKTITVPPEITKNGRQHTFPYGNMTAAILSTVPKGKYLFPARKTWRKGGRLITLGIRTSRSSMRRAASPIGCSMTYAERWSPHGRRSVSAWRSPRNISITSRAPMAELSACISAIRSCPRCMKR
jgi:integrase